LPPSREDRHAHHTANGIWSYVICIVLKRSLQRCGAAQGEIVLSPERMSSQGRQAQ